MAPGAGPRCAAEEILRMPLRWLDGDTDDDHDRIADRGWFRGTRECSRYLVTLSGGRVLWARGFGGEWPVISLAEGWLAPAMPMVLTGDGGDGIDAGYAVRGDEIWREAGGVEKLFLALGDDGACPGEPFDLLWFGDGERFIVRRGTLTVEDMFAVVEAPVDPVVLDRILIRGRRVDRRFLDGISFDHPPAPARITVNRAVALAAPERWRDPEKFFLARADVQRTERSGNRLEVTTVQSAQAVFVCSDDHEGWAARREEGSYPITAFALRQRGQTLSLSADLDADLDILAPGVRERLAFDLRSDLITLG